MRHLDLFSGIGGFALAASWVWGDEYENVGHSEIDDYACKVYHRHFQSKCLGDITKVQWEEGQADLITGGFPCQPHSVAGKRKGSGDSRDLWGECVRALRMVRPRYALFENVPGLFVSDGGRFFNRVLHSLAEIGYDAEWAVVSAASVGAPHRRERVWIVAYASSQRRQQVTGGSHGDEGPDEGRPTQETNEPECHGQGRGAADVAHTERKRCKEQRSATTSNSNSALSDSWWSVEPNVGRVAHGIPSRVDRLKGLGNAIVPQVAAIILQRIKSNGFKAEADTEHNQERAG